MIEPNCVDLRNSHQRPTEISPRACRPTISVQALMVTMARKRLHRDLRLGIVGRLWLGVERLGVGYPFRPLRVRESLPGSVVLLRTSTAPDRSPDREAGLTPFVKFAERSGPRRQCFHLLNALRRALDAE